MLEIVDCMGEVGFRVEEVQAYGGDNQIRLKAPCTVYLKFRLPELEEAIKTYKANQTAQLKAQLMQLNQTETGL